MQRGPIPVPIGPQGFLKHCSHQRLPGALIHHILGKIPWRRKWQPTPAFSPEESQGQRNLVGYGSWGGVTKSQTWCTWATEHAHMASPEALRFLLLQEALSDGSLKVSFPLNQCIQLPYRNLFGPCVRLSNLFHCDLLTIQYDKREGWDCFLKKDIFRNHFINRFLYKEETHIQSTQITSKMDPSPSFLHWENRTRKMIPTCS